MRQRVTHSTEPTKGARGKLLPITLLRWECDIAKTLEHACSDAGFGSTLNGPGFGTGDQYAVLAPCNIAFSNVTILNDGDRPDTDLAMAFQDAASQQLDPDVRRAGQALAGMTASSKRFALSFEDLIAACLHAGWRPS